MHLLTVAGWPTILNRPELGNWLPDISSATAAGISVAVAGNIIISLALNLQKLAHQRLERERVQNKEYVEQDRFKTTTNGAERIDEEDESSELTPTGSTHPTGNAWQDFADRSTAVESVGSTLTVLETEPLLPNRANVSSAQYGSSGIKDDNWNPWDNQAHRVASSLDRAHVAATHSLMPIDVVTVQPIRPRTERTDTTSSKGQENLEDANESEYLRSKLWWSGFLLMNIGEMGNFISYAFAPASVVAPLGTFALIANCAFAPLMLGERFHRRDFFGIVLAVIGAVTVVLSANTSDTRLDHDALVLAISQHVFIAYSITYAVGAIILSILSESNVGRRHVFVDVGLCALFGGFTVLSTKAISTLLTKEWFEIFTDWITYPAIAILLATGVGQIRYLNRALMRFDSKIVVPTQFVMFNLSAIVGSAILYGDFKRATFHQIVTFFYGCAATFAGVFMIAWGSRSYDADEENAQLEDEQDDVEAAPGSPSDVASPRSVGVGSLSRLNRATLVIPDSIANSSTASPNLRHRHSLVSLVGLSPVQYSQRLLLVNTPPQHEFVRPVHIQDGEIAPGSFRRRTVSWVGDDGHNRVRRGGQRTTSAVNSRDASRSTEGTINDSPRRFNH